MRFIRFSPRRVFRDGIDDTVHAIVMMGVASAMMATLIALLVGTIVYADDSYGNGEYSGVGSIAASANLNGDQEVPKVYTGAHGSFSMKNENNNQSASYTLSASNLSSSFTAAHIHCGASGVNGPVIAGLNLGSGSLNNGSILQPAGGNCQTPIYDMEDLNKAIANGHVYVNVHTSNYPNGEIRGQLSGGRGSGGGYGDHHDYDGYDRNKGCDHNYGDKQKWQTHDWDGWNKDCGNSSNDHWNDNSPCRDKHNEWSDKDSCWCDNGKPDYDKDRYGNKKWNDSGNGGWKDSHGSENDWNKGGRGYGGGDWNDGKDGKDGKDGTDKHGSDYGKKDDHDEWENDGNDKNGGWSGNPGDNYGKKDERKNDGWETDVSARIFDRAGVRLGLNL